MRIQDILNDAQGGHAFANLARAFHLPPGKVDVAVGAMIDELIELIDGRMRSRRALAKIVDLLGKPAYEKVLDTPALLGATHTQVLGSEALAVIAGHAKSDRISRRAALVANVSEMISEYLLPVIAAMLVGALMRLTRQDFEMLLEGEPAGGMAPPEAGADAPLQLPNVAGGYGFSGSTSGSSPTVAPDTTSARYAELAEAIRRTDPASGGADPAEAVRGVLAAGLGLSLTPLDWMTRIQKWSVTTLNAVFAGWRR
jgi:hypothetical protein